jgi:hypothetical protein
MGTTMHNEENPASFALETDNTWKYRSVLAAVGETITNFNYPLDIV